MGIELTKLLILRHASKLTANELVCAGVMCLTALDNPNKAGQPARRYYAGWEPMAIALGYDSLTKSATETVRRAVKGLREKGVIEPLVEHARTGSRQSYSINIGLGSAPTNQRGYCPNESEGLLPQRIVGKSPHESQGPRKELGTNEDLDQDINLIEASRLTDARARREAK